ncbi:hypothetical protein D3C85_1523930 [compost metagenome]
MLAEAGMNILSSVTDTEVPGLTRVAMLLFPQIGVVSDYLSGEPTYCPLIAQVMTYLLCFWRSNSGNRSLTSSCRLFRSALSLYQFALEHVQP